MLEIKEYQDQNLKAIVMSSAFVPVVRMGVLSGFLGTMVIGSKMALTGDLDVGSFSVLVFLTQRFLWPFTTLSTLIDDYERSMASSDRIFDLLAKKRKIVNISNAKVPENIDCHIRFENVEFSYDPSMRLFKDLNMDIPFGSSVGIVGDTGSGKTTIAKLLLRL